jgi:hypothetical protein
MEVTKKSEEKAELEATEQKQIVAGGSSLITTGDWKRFFQEPLKTMGPQSGMGSFELNLEPIPNDLRLEGSKSYPCWSRRARLLLRMKGVEHYLEETCVEPADKSSMEWRVWNMTNAMVMLWLMNSMSASIHRMVELTSTAAEMWKRLHDTYIGLCNVRMVETQWKAEQLKQEGRTVQEYASELQHLWEDLDCCDPLQLSHPDCVVRAMAWLERRRVIHFLNGLNQEFEPRRVAMLCQSTLPTIEEAISAMVQEENRLRVMRGNNPGRSTYTIAGGRKCYNCGQKGHLSYNCPFPQSSDGRSGARRSSHCGVYGGQRGGCGRGDH